MFLFDHNIATALFAVAVGIVGIWLTSQQTVNSARTLARSFGLNDLIIGLTVVSIGTSLPEIFVNVISGGIGESELAIGTIVGSNLGQITLILGFTVLVMGGAEVAKNAVRRDGIVLICSTLFLGILGMDGHLSRLEGWLLVVLYLSYLLFLIRTTSGERASADSIRSSGTKERLLQHGILIVVGLAGVYISAELIVKNGLFVGRYLGVTGDSIGVLSGIGTSMPELAISIAALHQGAAKLSIGNLIGSNVTDTLFSLGIGVALSSYTFDPQALFLHYVYWLGATVLAITFMWKDYWINRIEGAILLGVFSIYVWHVF